MSAVLTAHPSAAEPVTNILAVTRRNSEIEELDAAIGRLSRHLNSCNYQLMVVLREFDERGGWLKWGFTDAVSWLRWRCDLSISAARDKLRVAHALKSLSAMSGAFKRGALSYSKVRSLTRIATVDTEEELIEAAMAMSATNVEAYCRQRKNASSESVKGANKAHNSRSLRLWRNDSSGKMNVSIELTLEEGELFQQAMEKASVQLSSEMAESDCRNEQNETSWSALQADAAMMIIREFLLDPKVGADSTKSKTHSTADQYQVVVHVDEQALMGHDSDEVKPGCSSELPVSTVRRLCCDGSVVPIVENAKGEPLNVGRKVRTIPTAIRRALWARDRGCVFPGCHCKRYVDAHHVKHWADGGETSLDNLLLLCTRHHRMVHEGGYGIERDENQRWYFKRPDGIAVPKCGYRLDDLQDDFSENVSFEELFGADFGQRLRPDCVL